MVFLRRLRFSLLFALMVIGALVLQSGCLFSPDEDKTVEDTRLPGRDTPAGTIARLAKVWEQKRFAEYEQILHDQYSYWILDDDLTDLAWAVGQDQSWARTTELDFARNMFDPDFSGNEAPVDTIEWTFDILSTIQRDEGGVTVHVITTDANIQVLTGPVDGFRSDTRFEFEIVPDSDEPGLFQIRRQQELDKL